MKLERLHEYVMITVVTVLGILFALYFGSLVGGGQSSKAVMILGTCSAVAIILSLRTNLWILIPLFWPLSGTLPSLPSAIPLRDLVIAFVFLAFLLFRALKVVKSKSTFELIDVLLLVNILYLVTVFCRNPVGTESMGADRVGGRPYIEVIFALMAYWVIGHATVSAKLAGRLPLVMVSGDILSGCINFVTFHFPVTAPLISRFYTGIDVSQYNALSSASQNSGGFSGENSREQYLAPLGNSIIRTLCSYFSPVTLINPLFIARFGLFLLALFMILRSGHRTGILTAMVTFSLAAYFRRGMADLLRMAALGIPFLGVLLLLQGNLVDLPLPAQRALSFLPGKWDPNVVSDAKGSTEWRQEIWRNVLSSDKYITNRWFGDGFGMTRRQLQEMAATASQTYEGNREGLTIAGDYHNGPLSAIHIVGYFGTVLFYLLMLHMVIYSWKLISRTKATPYFGLTLFVGIGVIYLPLYFTFVFGAYKGDIVTLIFSAALLKLIKRSLDAHLRQAGGGASDFFLSAGAIEGRPELIRPTSA